MLLIDCFILRNSSSVSKNFSSSVCRSMILRSFLRLNNPFDCFELFNRLMRRVAILFRDSLDVEKLISSLNGTPKISSRINATSQALGRRVVLIRCFDNEHKRCDANDQNSTDVFAVVQ